MKENLHTSVHYIAWHYHWSKKDILSLPIKEISFYVDKIKETNKRKK